VSDDELEGFHLVDSTKGFLVSSSERDNVRSVVIDWRQFPDP
jgi:hypothetical protein